MNITPKPHFLNSIRGDRGKWSTLLAEGVDNALDADATEIAMRLEETRVVIEDNGQGITKARQGAIVTLGDHQPMATTQLGRFGMGIKYNAISAADVMRIESYSKDGGMQLEADWPHVSRSGKWEVDDPLWFPVRVGSATGTTLELRELRWRKPTSRDVLIARNELTLMFYPALQQGRTIRLNGQSLVALAEPLMHDIVEQTIQLPNGKGAHVRAGLLTDSGALCQVHVSYKHRVIEPESAFGCGSYTGLRRMFARVELTGSWGLSRFKNEIDDKDEDDLEKAVEDVLRPILEQCQSEQLQVDVDELTTLLNERLPHNLRARPRHRTKQPTSTKRERRARRPQIRPDDDVAPTGPTQTPAANQLMITLDAPCNETYGLGFFTKGRPNRITLSRDNPYVAAVINLPNRDLTVQILVTWALMIYEHTKAADPQLHLPFDSDIPFGLRVWQIAAQKITDADAVNGIES